MNSEGGYITYWFLKVLKNLKNIVQKLHILEQNTIWSIRKFFRPLAPLVLPFITVDKMENSVNINDLGYRTDEYVKTI